jgi:iron complex outermembrane receptor protein
MSGTSGHTNGGYEMRIHRHLLFCIALPATVMALAAAAQAQAPAATAQPPAGRDGVLEEVIITAERRAESLNQMAVAGEAFSTLEIERRAINEIEDLAGQTPGLSIKDSGVNRFVTIRGVGLNATTATITSGVATNVDGIPIWGAGIALGNPFYDLERIEVLRGPQGTFVGQNSTGGAMFVISRSPRLGESDFSIEQTLGNYKASDTVAAGNLALTDTTAARIAVKVERRDSFYTNRGTLDPVFGFNTSDPKLTTAYYPGDQDAQSVRLKYLWKPAETFDVLFMHERYKRRTDGTPQQPIYNFVNTGVVALNVQYANEIRANTDPYLLAYNSPSRFDIDLDRSSLEVNWQITPGVALRSQTAVQHFTQARLIDLDGTIHPVMPVWYSQGGANPATPYLGRAGSPLSETGSWTDTQIGPNRTRSQELNLLSTAEGALQWSLGLFYQDQKAQQNSYTSILESGANRQQTTIMNNRNKQSNRAVFGQITWRVSEQFELITGLRYNQDKSENPGGVTTIYRPNPQNATTAAVLPAQTIRNTSFGSAASSAATGKLALNWHLGAQQIIYGVVARGYKAGNFNNQNPLAVVNVVPSFEPESVNSFETGWKATLFDGRFHSDLTAFRTDYDDYQLAIFDPGTQQNPVSNLPKARIQGVELQVRAQFGGFGANLAASKLSAEVIESGNVIDGRRRAVPQNLSGRRLPFAPPHTFSAGVEYAIPLAAGTLTPRVQYAATGEQWATIFQIPSLVPGTATATNAGTADGGVSPDYLPSYHTVDASLTWTPSERWMFQVFGSNLADEVYIAGHTGEFRIYSAPRQFGLRLRYSN